MAGIGALPAAEVLGVYIHASTGSTGTDFVTWTWSGAVNNKDHWQVSAEDKPKGFTHVPSLDLYEGSCPENTWIIGKLSGTSIHVMRTDGTILPPYLLIKVPDACKSNDALKNKFTGLIPRRVPEGTLSMFGGKDKNGGIIFKTVEPSIPKGVPVALRKLPARVAAPSLAVSRVLVATPSTTSGAGVEPRTMSALFPPRANAYPGGAHEHSHQMAPDMGVLPSRPLSSNASFTTSAMDVETDSFHTPAAPRANAYTGGTHEYSPHMSSDMGVLPSRPLSRDTSFTTSAMDVETGSSHTPAAPRANAYTGGEQEYSRQMPPSMGVLPSRPLSSNASFTTSAMDVETDFFHTPAAPRTNA
jgi:hypothetical protein